MLLCAWSSPFTLSIHKTGIPSCGGDTWRAEVASTPAGAEVLLNFAGVATDGAEHGSDQLRHHNAGKC